MPSSSPFTLRAALRRQRLLVCALLLMTAIIAVAATGAVPLAGYLFAALLIVLALLRVTLPVESVGALAVRTRFLDVCGLLILAIGFALLSSAPNL